MSKLTFHSSGGVRFPDLDEQEQYDFQENLVRTMLSIEHTFFTLAESCKQNCLVICDRGIMDASACEYSLLCIICLRLTNVVL